MLTEYKAIETLPATSKLWVYQSNKELTVQDQTQARELLDYFMQEWNSHGTKLIGTYNIFYNRFIVISVDESIAYASGCSIDKSVQLIKQIEGKLGIQLLNRSEVAFKISGEIVIFPLTKIKEQVALGNITPKTITFNNSITTVKEFTENWEIEAGNSWLARYF